MNDFLTKPVETRTLKEMILRWRGGRRMFEKKKALDVFQISEEAYDELLKEFIAQADVKIKAVEGPLKTATLKRRPGKYIPSRAWQATCAWMIATMQWWPLNRPCGRTTARKRKNSFCYCGLPLTKYAKA